MKERWESGQGTQNFKLFETSRGFKLPFRMGL